MSRLPSTLLTGTQLANDLLELTSRQAVQSCLNCPNVHFSEMGGVAKVTPPELLIFCEVSLPADVDF